MSSPVLTEDDQRRVVLLGGVALAVGGLIHALLLGGFQSAEVLVTGGGVVLFALGLLPERLSWPRRVGALIGCGLLIAGAIALRGIGPAIGAVATLYVLVVGLLFSTRAAMIATVGIPCVAAATAGLIQVGAYVPAPAPSPLIALDTSSATAWLIHALSFLGAAVGTAALLLRARRLVDTAHAASLEALVHAEEERARAEQTAEARLRAETTLREAQKLQAVTHASVGLRRLLGNALMVVGGALVRLRRTPSDEVAKATARTIITTLEPLRAVLGGLLRLSRTRRKKGAQVQDLARVLEEVASELRPTLNTNVDLAVQHLESPVAMHETELRRALVYVLQNAVEALPEGGHIVVETRHVRLLSAPSQAVSPLPKGDYIACSIKDDGVGMSPEHARRAFDAFFTSKPPNRHLGTGLLAALQIVEAHGGTIALESRKGRGTRVTFYLPRPHAEVTTRFAPTKEQTHFGHEEEDATLSEPGLSAPAPLPTGPTERRRRHSLLDVPDWADETATTLARSLLVIIALGTTWRFAATHAPPLFMLPVVGVALSALLYAQRARTNRRARAMLVVLVPAVLASATLSITSFLSATVITGMLFSVACSALLLGPVGVIGATLLGLAGFATAATLAIQGTIQFPPQLAVLLAPETLLRTGVTLCGLLLGLTLSTVRVLDALTRSTAQARLATIEAEVHAEETAATNRQLMVLARQETRCERVATAGTVVGTVTHDVNNALHVLLNCAELLEEGPSDPDFDATVSQMEQSLIYAEALCQQFAFDDSEAPSHTPVHVAAEARRALSMVRAIMPEDIHIVDELDDTGLVQLASQDVLRIIFNLATNARDAMPNGGQLSVRLHYLAHDNVVQLRVSDTGHGMDKRTQARAFDAFYTTKKSGEGTGLGLFTMQQIVQRTHGRLSLQTTPGEGTTWDIRWPALRGAELPTHEVDASGVRERGGRLLLVEPDPVLREQLTATFEEHGYQVTGAGKGDTAREALRGGQTFDALITDAPLEGYPAPRLINEFRRRHPMHPVVLCSGHLSRDGVAWVERHQEVVFVQKPCRAQDLLHAVEAAASASGVDAPPQRLLTLPPLDAVGS